ncbi:MAG: hypothetical protein Q7J73_05125 [Dehalococcoidales bacterium]|nr:hypothetical protein [Dehalococcoidales bacterium]
MKKKRGGQPGNQNGRVHGLYSKSLTPQEQQYLQSVLKITGLDQEVALLCTKFASILANDPGNREALYKVLSSMDRLLGYDRQKLVDTLKNVLRSPSLTQDESGTH